MGAIKIKGATSGSTTITAPATGGDEVIELSTALDAKLNSTAYQPGLTLITSDPFSAVSSVSVDGVFTADYQNYLMIVSGTISANNWIDFRLRASGVNATGNDYTRQSFEVSTTTTIAGRLTETRGRLVFSNSQPFYAVVQLNDPANAVPTYWMSHANRDGANPVIHLVNGQHSLSTVYDGVSIIAGSGTITGTVRVYGYRN